MKIFNPLPEVGKNLASQMRPCYFCKSYATKKARICEDSDPDNNLLVDVCERHFWQLKDL